MDAPYATGDIHQFPYRIVVILALVLSINSYTLANLFPYVGMMVKHLLGLATTNESGFYAGYIASAFTFGRFLSGYAWGCAADVIGRKPVIIVGLSAIVAMSVAFGLSTTFAMAITSRFILGLLNGIMPAVRTTVHEVCGPEHVVMGLAYVGGSRGIGLVLGTGVGGILAQPALYYPHIFSPTGVFGKYPFLMPNLFGACGAVLMLVLVILYLPETRKSEKHGAEPETSSGVTKAESSLGSTTRSDQPIGRSRDSKNAQNGSLAYEFLRDDGAVGVDREEKHGGAVVLGTMMAQETVISMGNNEDTRGHGDVRTKVVWKKTPEATQHYQLLDSVAGGGDEDDTEIGIATECRTSYGDDVSGTAEFPPRSTAEGYEDLEDPGLCGPTGLLSTPNVKMILFLVCVVQMVIIGFDEVFPLWALSTPSVGGLGWGTMQIGKVLGMTGIVMCVLQLCVVPGLIKKVGVVNWQRAGCLVGIPIFLAVPNAKFFSWNESSLLGVAVLTNLLVNICIGSVSLALTVASTSIAPPHQRGKLGGLFMTAESLGRFVGPTGFSTCFAWSISPSARGYVDYHLVFFIPPVVLAVVSVMGWKTLTLETLMQPAARGEAAATSGPIPPTLPPQAPAVRKT